MSESDRDVLGVSRTALRALVALNWAFGAAVLAMLAATFVAPAWIARALGVAGEPRVLAAMRAIMVIGIAATPITNVVLTRLASIVDTVRAGDPFVAGNASRLQTIAWAVLALELAHVAVVGVANAASSPTLPLHVGGTLSVAPWLSVLLLFVLARVFEHGANMREELEATI